MAAAALIWVCGHPLCPGAHLQHTIGGGGTEGDAGKLSVRVENSGPVSSQAARSEGAAEQPATQAESLPPVHLLLLLRWPLWRCSGC